MKNNTFSHLLSCYLTKYLPGIAGLSTNTIMSYRDMFKNLIVFYETKLNIKPEKICIDNFNSGNIISFLKWLESDRGNSVSTRNVRLASIHAFARYVERHLPESIHIMQEVLSIRYKKCPSLPPVFINADATKLLLTMPDVNTINGRRDRVLLSLLYDSGARVQELCDLTVSDIRLDEPCTVKLTGKGGKTRIVPIMKPMAGLLRQYIKEQDLYSPNCNCYSLFRNRSRCKFTRKGITYILHKYFTNAKQLYPDMYPENISPHCLRHSKSMHLFQSGVNLIYIRDILSHADVKTTEIYARIDSEMKREALEKASLGSVSDKMPAWQEDKSLLGWLKELG
jgi:site-specific recombinase XerD